MYEVFRYKRSTLPKEVNATSVDVTISVVGREVVVTKEQNPTIIILVKLKLVTIKII